MSMFREDGVWYVAIDSTQKMQLNVDVDLEKECYFVAGASTTPDLTMTVHKVYIDGKVTKEMKEGVVVQSVASSSNVGNGNVTGGTALEKGEGNAFITREESNVDPDNLTDSVTNTQMIIWAVSGVLACAVVAGSVIFFMKKKKETV